jgi:hypothetical protein
VRVQVEGNGVLLASTHLTLRGALVKDQCAAGDRLGAGLTDPVLAAGVGELGDVASDVLALVGQDLELLAGKVRAGVALYDRVEERVRDGMSRA